MLGVITSRLTKLEKFTCEMSQIGNLQQASIALKELSQMKYLKCINGEGTSEDWSALVKIPTIVELYFQNCHGVTNEVIENYLCDLHVKLPILEKIEKC